MSQKIFYNLFKILPAIPAEPIWINPELGAGGHQ